MDLIPEAKLFISCVICCFYYRRGETELPRQKQYSLLEHFAGKEEIASCGRCLGHTAASYDIDNGCPNDGYKPCMDLTSPAGMASGTYIHMQSTEF